MNTETVQPERPVALKLKRINSNLDNCKPNLALTRFNRGAFEIVNLISFAMSNNLPISVFCTSVKSASSVPF